DEPAGAESPRLRSRLRRAVRRRRRDRNDRRGRRFTVASRSRWPPGAPGGGRRCAARGGQRLPPRRHAGAADGAPRHARAPRVGGTAARGQHAAARRRARDNCRQARRPLTAAAMARREWLAAAAVACAAFALYRATLLPGLDFGDTGFLQTAVTTWRITPRDGYPLYFALGKLIVRLSGGEPAHALNLASAIEAAH